MPRGLLNCAFGRPVSRWSTCHFIFVLKCLGYRLLKNGQQLWGLTGTPVSSIHLPSHSAVRLCVGVRDAHT